MNTRQRHVVAVAVGLAIATIVNAINSEAMNMNGGWFNYSPDLGVTADSTDIWQEAAVWLLGIGMWAGFAAWLYRRAPS
jgi:hypothetical protein